MTALREHALVIGEVTFSSGARAAYYVDAKRAILRPDCVFADLGDAVGRLRSPVRASAVGGVPVSAIPVACAALAAAAPRRAGHARRRRFIVRKERKEHGLERLSRGTSAGAGRALPGGGGRGDHGRVHGGAARAPARRGGDGGGRVLSVLDRLAGGAAAIDAAVDAPYVALTTIDDVYPDRPDR